MDSYKEPLEIANVFATPVIVVTVVRQLMLVQAIC